MLVHGPWLAPYLCREVYETVEMTLSHEELGRNYDGRSRSHTSCEQMVPFGLQALPRGALCLI